MQILIHADDFLHNMARIIVGTLMDIGLGNRSVQDIDDISCGNSRSKCALGPEGIVFAGDYVLNLITIECMKRSLPGPP